MAQDPRIGSVLAGHRVDALIGRGGMGVVYRATHLRLKRTVALKLLAPELTADASFRQNFEREAELAAALDHPHIVPIYDAGQAGEVLYLSMRYVQGTDLGALIRTHGALGLDRTYALLSQAAAALDAAHAAGLVHRDVKPANILITDGAAGEHVYICDFGITRHAASRVTNQLAGTFAYMAPERFLGLPPRAGIDLYALGCVAYECLTGRTPFERGSLEAAMYAHLHRTPPPASEQQPGLPPAVDAVLARAMAKEPADRYPTCEAFVAALRAAGRTYPYPQPPHDIQAGGPRAAQRPPDPVAASAEPSRWDAGGRAGRRVGLAAALVMALILAVLGLVRWLPDRGPAVLPGVDPRSAAQARLSGPRGVAVDADGALYIADQLNHRVLRVDASGAITTVAGTGTEGFSGDGGPATQAQLALPTGVAVGDGTLYIADLRNSRVRSVDSSGTITTVAGTGTEGFSGDGGPATQAQLADPWEVAVGADGLLYIADLSNHRVRRVDGSGVITTVAGTGVEGFSGDGGPATQAQLAGPRGVAVDADGALYIADFGNHRVRRVDGSGVITTVAGTGTQGLTGDGGPATQAQLTRPDSVAVDADGTLSIADYDNDRVRRVDPAGTITTVAGGGSA